MSTNVLKLKPVKGKIVIKPEERKQGTIVMPDNLKEEVSEKGVVVAVHDWDSLFNVGDSVIYSKYSVDTIIVDEVEYYFINEDEILATYEQAIL